VANWQARRQLRGLHKDAGRLEADFVADEPGPRAADRLARDYGRVLRAALKLDPPLASRLFRDYDARVPRTSASSAISCRERTVMS
jgi:hypothetical protein